MTTKTKKQKIRDAIYNELDFYNMNPLAIANERGFSEAVFWALNDDGVNTSADEVQEELQKYKKDFMRKLYGSSRLPR